MNGPEIAGFYWGAAFLLHGIFILANFCGGMVVSLVNRSTGGRMIERSLTCFGVSFVTGLFVTACAAYLQACRGDMPYRCGLAIAILAVFRVPSWAEKCMSDDPICAPLRQPLRTVRRSIPVEPLAADDLQLLSIELDGRRARCPVCNHSILGEPAKCRKCRAPHHHDCMDYMGRCGIYGCAYS